MSDKPTLLIAIYSDPQTSGAPAEALRMGMGLATGNRQVQIVLMGPAVKVLTDEVDELIDGEMMENYLEVYEDWGTPFHVGAAALAEYDTDDAQVVAIGDGELAAMMAKAQQVLVFP